MKKILVSLCCTILVLNFQVLAMASMIEIPAGTPVSLMFEKSLDADEIKQGDIVDLTVMEPVKINGFIAIKAGTPVTGEIVYLKNNGILGIPGEIKVGNLNLKTSQGDVIHLRGTIDDKGVRRAWANVGWIIVWPLVFVKGNDAKIASGSYRMMHTAGDYTISDSSLCLYKAPEKEIPVALKTKKDTKAKVIK